MENDNEQIRESLLQEIMHRNGIDKEEAGKRLDLLYQSDFFKQGHPEDAETKMFIDHFLSIDSTESSYNVLLESAINKCAMDAEFVAQYDRLNGRSMAYILKRIEAGNPPKNVEYEFARFGKFVEETVVSRFVTEQQ